MTTILIAEDNDDVRTLLHRVFDRAGFIVLTAVDGRDALHTAQQHHPDIVLTDFDMPHVDGGQLCRAIRADPCISDTPVVILSGGLHPGDARVHDARACHVLLKPVPNDELVAVVRQLVGEGRHDHHPSALAHTTTSDAR